MSFSIRRAQIEDAAAISALVIPLTRKFISYEFTPEGEKIMLEALKTSVIAEHLGADYDYYLAFDDSLNPAKLAGVIGIKNASHIFHLFVAQTYHRQGVARKLWLHFLAQSQAQQFTVNSSRYAVEFYQRQGFQPSAQLFEKNGITCYPMVLNR